MGSGVVVLFQPAIDRDLCLPGVCEPFGIENLAAERSVEPSLSPFFWGEPGRIRVGLTPTLSRQR